MELDFDGPEYSMIHTTHLCWYILSWAGQKVNCLLPKQIPRVIFRFVPQGRLWQWWQPRQTQRLPGNLQMALPDKADRQRSPGLPSHTYKHLLLFYLSVQHPGERIIHFSLKPSCASWELDSDLCVPSALVNLCWWKADSTHRIPALPESSTRCSRALLMPWQHGWHLSQGSRGWRKHWLPRRRGNVAPKVLLFLLHMICIY